jgi:anaerobic ribonucleoside-triphosphate reductase activating protein
VDREVTTLGHGTRAGIRTQGCTIGCAECVSKDTWSEDPATLVNIDVLLGWLRSLPEPLDGVTVSGGEPFQQPTALAALLQGVDAWRADRSRPVDILVYSGYSLCRSIQNAGRATRSAKAAPEALRRSPAIPVCALHL